MGWPWEWRKDKWTKVPIDPRTGGNASCDDPWTWGNFDQAVERYQEDDSLAGIGFEFSADDPYCGVDLDDCQDPDTGVIDDWGRDELRQLDTCAEQSPTRTGVKAIVRGKKPGDKCRKKYRGGEVEVYDRGRFFTITGHTLPGSPSTIPDRQQALDALYRRVFGIDKPKPAPKGKPQDNGHTGKGKRFTVEGYGGSCPLPLSADETKRWNCLRESKTDRIKALWAGDISAYGNDDSRADAALCSFLAILTNGDRGRIEELLGKSKLGEREKWKGREDYRDRTSNFALDGFDPWKNDPAAASGGQQVAGDDGLGIILDDLRERLQPRFRRGQAVFSEALGREVKPTEGCFAPDRALVEKLAKAIDAPRDKNGVDTERLPKFYREWARPAWQELLGTLPEETAMGEGEIVESAEEEFRKAVEDALHEQVTFDDREDKPSRYSLIDWAYHWAKPGPWRQVRSYLLWCRRDSEPSPVEVAVRIGLFCQARRAGLAQMTHRQFAALCNQYGVGNGDPDAKACGNRVVILAPEFLDSIRQGREWTDGRGRNESARACEENCVHPSNSTQEVRDI